MNPDDPRHGTVAGYNRIPCREECCRRAMANYRKRLEWDRMNGRPRIVSTLGVRRRLQALNALGWSNRAIAERAGMADTNLTRLLACDTMTSALRDRLVTTYEALSMRLPVGNAQAIAHVRNRARRHGWPPPLAWDDIDDPNGRPNLGTDHRSREDVDEATVLRVMAGEKLPTTRAEKDEVVRRWRERGWGMNELERMTGWQVGRYSKKGEAA